MSALSALHRHSALGVSLLLAAALLSCGGTSSSRQNQPPTLSSATFDNGGVPFNGAKSLDLLALTRAVDPEGGAISFRLNRTVSGADIGSLTVSGITGTFVPLAGVEGSAVFELVAVDAKGAASGPANLTVASVDTYPPLLLDPVYDTTAPTNHDVAASVQTPEKEDIPAPSGWTRAGAIGNWAFSRTYTANIAGDPFTLTDRAGNASTRLITITNIDKVAPVVEDASYSTTAPTNLDVVATFRCAENLAAPAGWAKSWDSGSGKYVCTKTFAANVAETVSFFDAAGNRTDKVVAITWIDKTAPAIVTFEAASITHTAADLHVLVDENGKGYLWFPSTVPTADPTVTEVVQHATTSASVLSLTRNQLADYAKSGLQADTAYAAFLVTEDALGNRSAVRKLSLRTQQNPDAPTFNPAPEGVQSGNDVSVSWALADADGVQFGKAELYKGMILLATLPNYAHASSYTFTRIPRGSFHAIAYGKALNGSTGQWQDVTSPQSAPIVVVNHAPVLPASISLPAGSQGSAYSQTLPGATDLDGDTLTYSLTGTLPTGLSFSAITRTLAGTATQFGSFTLTYTASDGHGGSASRGVTLTVGASTFTISGNAGVAMALITSTGGTTTANGSGAYTFTVAYNWSGTVTPSLAGYTFSPASRTYANVLADQTAQNYTATAITYTISGNAGVANALLTYTGGTTTADGTGAYSFTVSYNWSGTVTPSLAGYTFSPASRTYSNVLADQAAQNYTATAITPSISGNAGMANALLTYTGGTTSADGTGAYSFTVPNNWSGSVTPSKPGYMFTPSSRTYSNVLINQTSQNFTATLYAPTSPIAHSPTDEGFTAMWIGNPAATDYLVDVAFDPACTMPVSGKVGLHAGTATSLVITGLQSGTSYYFQVRASDGTLTSSNAIASMPILTKPAAPMATDATGVTQSQFIANWNTVPSALSYKLGVSTSSTFAVELPGSPFSVGTSTSITFTPPTPNMTYYYRAIATNISGDSKPSNIITVVLLPPP